MKWGSNGEQLVQVQEQETMMFGFDEVHEILLKVARLQWEKGDRQSVVEMLMRVGLNEQRASYYATLTVPLMTENKALRVQLGRRLGLKKALDAKVIKMRLRSLNS